MIGWICFCVSRLVRWWKCWLGGLDRFSFFVFRFSFCELRVLASAKSESVGDVIVEKESRSSSLSSIAERYAVAVAMGAFGKNKKINPTQELFFFFFDPSRHQIETVDRNSLKKRFDGQTPHPFCTTIVVCLCLHVTPHPPATTQLSATDRKALATPGMALPSRFFTS